MTTWADYAVVISLVLMPLAGASESARFFGPDRPWLLPNRVRSLVGVLLLSCLLGGLYFQDYPRSAPQDSLQLDFFGQVRTAFSRVF